LSEGLADGLAGETRYARQLPSDLDDANGEPLWLGAATNDERVEISRTTGGVTHKISDDIDKERNKVVTDAHQSGVLTGFYWIDQFHPERQGYNGGGDPYFTDGRLAVGVIEIRR